MKLICRAFLLLCFAGVSSGQDLPKPKLVFAQMPQYPVLARLTHTQGEVKLVFVLNTSGEPLSVTAVSGNAQLKPKN
jgi:hypothetical protein